MKLTVKDRIILLNILPCQGSILQISNTIDCSKILALNEQEKEEFGYTDDGQRATWNPEIDTTKEVELKHEHVSLLKESIQKIDEAGTVTIDQYQTFVKIKQL